MNAYPLADRALAYDAKQVETFVNTIFRHVDWQEGQVFSIRGIGEKGTDREGVFRENHVIPPAFVGAIHAHLKRWAEWNVASFIVPAVLHNAAEASGDVRQDKIAALTAILLDLDSGDIAAKSKFVTERLGRPTLVVASGGLTQDGQAKLHLYWLLSEPSEEVERVAALRKLLAAKVGGDQSFGRSTQVIRIAGSVHAKNNRASLCEILDQCDADYDLEDIAEIIESMEPMPGIEPPAPLLSSTPTGMMDFTPRTDTAIAAMHRDVHAGGDDLTRWSEFSKVVGFNIAEVRAGRLSPEQAYTAANGWMLEHMVPPWPQARFDQEFKALVARDVENHGPFTPTIAAVQAQAKQAGAIQPTPASWPAARFIPPRPWLFGRWLQRGIVTAVVAPGGVGKSSLMASMTLSLASGKEFLGKTVYGGPLKCWYWNLEDGGDNLARGRVAAGIHHRVGAEECSGRLFVDSGPEGAELCTAVEDRTGFAIIEPVMENVTAAIKALGIDVLIIDPFVSSHSVNENDNNKIDAVAKRWARVAIETQCSIVLVHHSTKMRGEKVTAESARGAGALNNAARVTLVLNRMSDEQADMWSIPTIKAPRFFSVADDKHNLSPAEGADWFELVSVDLHNGNDIHEGDSIGVVTCWRPPQAMDGVDVEHLFQVQSELHRAASADRYHWFATNTQEDWAGGVIAMKLGLDMSDPGTKTRCAKILSRWIESGALKTEMRRKDVKNKKPVQTKAVVVGNWVREPNTV